MYKAEKCGNKRQSPGQETRLLPVQQLSLHLSLWEGLRGKGRKPISQVIQNWFKKINIDKTVGDRITLPFNQHLRRESCDPSYSPLRFQL